MTEHIIQQATVDAITSRISEIESITYTDFSHYQSVIGELFDGEIALMSVSERIINETLELLAAHGLDLNKTQLQSEIVNTVNKSILVGFLSERYSRDVLMDDKTVHDNRKFSRGYEKIEEFIKRRIGKHDYQHIAKTEADKTENT